MKATFFVAFFMGEGMKTLVSLSGGKTSATLIETFGKDADYIFMNTGFEHPKTYEFLRNLKSHYGVNIICLEPIVHFGVRKSNTYKIIDVDDAKLNPFIMIQHVQKYGGFTFKLSNCSERIKTRVIESYVKENYEKKEIPFRQVIGFRVDEQKRMLGRKAYKLIRALGYTADDVVSFKQHWVQIFRESGAAELEYDIRSRFPIPPADIDLTVRSIVQKVKYLSRYSIEYMAEHSDFDKQDVADFWSDMPFTLDIPEHLGNCIFCVKKNRKKIALAARDCPWAVPLWKYMVDQRRADDMERNRQYAFPGRNKSLQEVIDEYAHVSTEDLRDWVYNNVDPNESACATACDPFGSQLDIMEEQLSEAEI
nr:hypothetical protein BCU03_09500 [Vibrio breoganii]